MTDGSPSGLPTIAVISPVLNGAKFLGACIDSILDQNYPKLQYVVMDGGSSDGSVAIIAAHASRLHYWQSQPDGGQYAAIAAGFAKTDAEILAWLNGDDIYLPWTLATVGRIFRDCPSVEWLTTQSLFAVDGEGAPRGLRFTPGYTAAGFRRGDNLVDKASIPGTSFIQQEATFWRRSLWQRSGARFDDECKLAGDFELWDRFFDHAPLYSFAAPLAAFRSHGPDQRSIRYRAQYVAECRRVLQRRGANPPDPAALMARYAHMANLHVPQLVSHREAIHYISRDATDRFAAMTN